MPRSHTISPEDAVVLVGQGEENAKMSDGQIPLLICRFLAAENLVSRFFATTLRRNFLKQPVLFYTYHQARGYDEKSGTFVIEIGERAAHVNTEYIRQSRLC